MIEIVENIDSRTRKLLQEIKKKDIITLRHSLYVGFICVRFAEFMEIKEKYPHIYTGAVLHDIGKTQIPDSILMKASRLTDEEYLHIKNHTLYGAEILKNEGYSEEIINMAKYHHERIDGRGYVGITNCEIPYEAKILSLIDAYDAMTGTRPYREKMSLQDAVDELRRFQGSQFDNDLCDKFVYFLENKFMN